MRTRSMTKADFDQIVEVIDHWWGGPISTFAHPIFFYELGEKALIVESSSAADGGNGQMVGFLLGFIAHEPVRTGYVHLVGIHPAFRRQGVGRLLYGQFTSVCREAKCERMKAITTLGNEGSQRFHLALGWDAQQIENYAGPGRKRIVFTKSLIEP